MTSMNSILSRIEEIAKDQSRSLSSISIDAGMSKDGIRNWKRRAAKDADFGVSYANLTNVAKALGVPVSTLEGNPVQVANDDDAPYSALVPVYDVLASAGPGAIVDSYEAVTHSLAFPPDYLTKITRSKPEHLAIIGVKGDSMAPTLSDDDIVMVDASKKNLSFDGMFVLQFGDALHVKRVTRSSQLGMITILSDNSAKYPAQEWPAEEVTVVGKVIWTGGKV